MEENDTETHLPPMTPPFTESAIPKDLRDTGNFIVEHDVLGTIQLANEAREVINEARCYTLGQAVRALNEHRPDMKVIIRMPEPRRQPWVEVPAILVGGRLPPGVTVRLNNEQRANLLELLKLIGFRNGNPPEPLSGLGGLWMAELGLDVESGDPISERPSFTHEELRERLKMSRRPPPGWGWHPGLIPSDIQWTAIRDGDPSTIPPDGKRVLVRSEGLRDGGNLHRVQEDELEAGSFWKFGARHVTDWAELP